MTPRTALGALHIGALMFGLTGVFGKLAAASPAIIVFGRAAFAVLALAFFARFASQTRWQKLEGDRLPKSQIIRAIDLPHTAPAERRHDSIAVAQKLPRHEPRGMR